MAIGVGSASTAAAAAVVITGPTGVGKSAVAVELARRIGGEIISADSVQVTAITTHSPPLIIFILVYECGSIASMYMCFNNNSKNS